MPQHRPKSRKKNRTAAKAKPTAGGKVKRNAAKPQASSRKPAVTKAKPQSPAKPKPKPEPASPGKPSRRPRPAPKAAPPKATKVVRKSPGKSVNKSASKPAAPMTLVDAAVAVLAANNGQGMKPYEIVEAAIARDLWKKQAGKTPDSTLWSRILDDMRKKGRDSSFVKTAPGTFGLSKSAMAKLRDAAEVQKQSATAATPAAK